MIPQPTLDWLRQVSAAYTTQERLFQDVTQTLEMHPGLTPKTDYFTQDDGQTSVLLSLGGTIGVKYKNSLYNIPIRLWIPRIYPNCGPFAFVEPTETMVIKAGQHVDVSGRIYHPYLAYWPQRTQSTIFEFIGILQQLFGEDPPVYAKA
ncbi:ubiquitin E2 variant, partial [Gorgonomyces haynaldii]